MLVAAAAAPAFQKKKTSVFAGHVGDDFATLRLTDYGALRHFDDDILAVFAGTVLLAALLAVFRTVFADVPEICQSIQSLVHLKVDAAAVSAVAAVGTAVRHIFLTPERDVTVAALAAFHIYFRMICKHDFSPLS